jgi:endonuclease/exonuclease/phosphatase family metal-dependent hydrolase
LSRTKTLWSLAGLLTAAVFIVVLFFAWVLRGVWTPAKTTDVAITCDGQAPALARGQSIRAMVWNIQFSAGRSHEFFYDGGPAVSVSESEVRQTLDAITAAIAQYTPDLVLLQEVDRDSRRTHHVDQLAEILKRTPYPCHAATPYFKAEFVPHPPHEPLGKVDMQLAVLSRFAMGEATRHQLPLLKESWLRQQFNLKRALLQTTVPIEGGGSLAIFNSHLSAYAKGDGTLEAQIEEIDAHLAAASAAQTPWILGADLNALPPGDDTERLGTAADLYAAASPLDGLFATHTPAVPRYAYTEDPVPWRTWLPYGSTRADRTLDYVFTSPEVELLSFTVLKHIHAVSDHHPLLLEFRLR